MNHAIKIVKVLAAPGVGSFFFDDQAAIKAGAVRDGASYQGQVITAGYGAIREPSESVSVMLVLSDGYVAIGDCASVQYSGVGGREPRFHARQLAQQIERDLAPRLLGLDVRRFRASAQQAEEWISASVEARRAAAYGVSQALLNAAAHVAGHHVMARVIKDEWELPGPLAAVPIYAQSGDERYTNVDKMILKSVPILPHGLINTLELVGTDGAELENYVRWIVGRVESLKTQRDYCPRIHLDVYGMVGASVQGSPERTADILQRLEAAAGPHLLTIEHPLDAGSRDAQIAAMGRLRQILLARGSQVKIVADEWANTAEDIHLFAVNQSVDMIQVKTPDLGSIHNTVDAILDCHRHGVGPVLGGTCAETDQSARTTTHIGIATHVAQMLAKPGMGFDEGYTIVFNEMNRALRIDGYLNQFAA
ncbi:MAG: methylaspartate ammonia-lyase [Burkholderiaceae bacterium]|jgi:methylaspartate ammonia-lyase|nr:methylaspartate ammonia-lyase [Burkholderiaceae bacterium]